MWKTLLLFLSVAALTCQGYAQTDIRTKALDNKPGLDKPLTLTLRAVSLKDLLDQVQTETKVRMRPDREIAEDKVTIRVKDMPARDLLRAVAKCCNLGWVDAEIGDLRYLSLYMDRESKAAMTKKIYDDYALILSQFDKEMKATADAIRAKTQTAIPTDGSLANNDINRPQYRSIHASDAQLGSMAIQCANLTETQKKALFDGNEMHVSANLISKEALDIYPEATGYTYWVERSLEGYLLRGIVQPRPNEQECPPIAIALFDDARYDKLIATECEALAKDERLAKQVTLPTVENAAATEMPLPTTPLLPKQFEGSAATLKTMSDALLTIAEAADMPLVAQYLSEYSSYKTPPPASGKLCDVLALQCKLHKFTVARDGDVLQARAALWHRLREREVPEKTIKRWQAAIEALPAPTFETYLEMIGSTWAQIGGITSNYSYWFHAPGPYGLAVSQYACRLYSSLTPRQQSALWSGQSVPVIALRADQQNNFMQAFEQKERPSYLKAMNPNWQASSYLKLRTESLGGRLWAFANGRVRGVEPMSQTLIPQDGNSNQSSARIQPVSPEEIARATTILVDRIAREHPEIPRNTVAVYQENSVMFDTVIGQYNNTTRVYCSLRVN